MTQIVLPFIAVPDPTKSATLFSAQLFFGISDTDPELPVNQTAVSSVQENGDLIELPQPVQTNAGGVPQYNGSSTILDVDGNYSYKVLDRFGAQVYYVANVTNDVGGSNNFSGVVVEESTTLTAGQTVIALTTLNATASVFFLQTSLGDQGFLAIDIDYAVVDDSTIELTQSYNDGDVIIARQNDPTGELVPVNEDAVNLLVFNDVLSAQAAATLGNLVEGDTFTLNGSAVSGDGLGGVKYIAVITAFPNDGVNFIDLNGTLQAVLQGSYYRFQNYAETIGIPVINAGILTLDLNDGTAQDLTIFEDVTDVIFSNSNPSSSYSSTVTLRVIQNGIGGWLITWPATIKWPSNIPPVVTIIPNSIDVFGFVTYNAGVDWFGFIMGQDFL